MSEERDQKIVDEKYELITRNLKEILGDKHLKEILKERDLKCYWGTACTGAPHVGYLVPIFKIADFLNAGMHVKILFADIHAFLDNLKSSWELLQKRTEYYQFIIKEMLKMIGVPLEKLEFVVGSSFQLSSQYTLDMYKMTAMTTLASSKHSGADVVKQSDNPLMSGMLYPILQALDEEYLKVDVQFGGVDQRKIFVFAREKLPKIGYKKRIHLMNPLVPGLTKDGKMSSSIKESKIDFRDTDKQIKTKIGKAFAEPGVVEGNGLLALLKFVIFRKLEKDKAPFEVKRDEKWGGDLSFDTYEAVEKAYADKQLSPEDLKSAMSRYVAELIAPLRKAIEDNIDLYYAAYPSEAPKKKKEKKAKVNPFANFCNFQIKKARAENEEYANMKDKELMNKLQLGRQFGQLSQEEKLKWAQA